MEKKNFLQSIADVATEIIAMDDTHHTTSIELYGIDRVSVGYGGEIVEIDGNNMVLLEFEDTLGTTDWLPLGILDEHIIKNVLAKLVFIKLRMEEERKDIVYVISVEDSKTTKKVHKVFRKLRDAQEELLRLYNEYKANPNIRQSGIQYYKSLWGKWEDGYEVYYWIDKSKII